MNCLDWVNILLSLFIICSPFVAVPAMITLTKGQSEQEKRRVARIAAIAAGVILLGFAWVGAWIFSVLGIHLAALQVGGGFVVFLLGISALRSEHKGAEIGQSVAVVPLAIPLMAGPGAISQVIIAVEEFPGIVSLLWISLAVMVVALLLGICLRFATLLEKVLGDGGLNVLSNIGGLLLLAIAVETIVKGVHAFFPAFGV
jgi:multiple antibiotic resistance protein